MRSRRKRDRRGREGAGCFVEPGRAGGEEYEREGQKEKKDEEKEGEEKKGGRGCSVVVAGCLREPGRWEEGSMAWGNWGRAWHGGAGSMALSAMLCRLRAEGQESMARRAGSMAWGRGPRPGRAAGCETWPCGLVCRMGQHGNECRAGEGNMGLTERYAGEGNMALSERATWL